ncbi:methyl-accepting chemotaxis protein [Reinekea marinisedimentorum]|uniref:Methyl-accepting chemotaxis protein n=1 Tax=Reinekea marinisedimentorum TaxID=230495 RepID=A0A4R3IEP3_9GAMM|nr:methyl-accepting chemotaxis protein [Reinekea marinisedimentorum]TCS43261.1 methyl-accepting chemotaxis protein [Reinekea marinisedimentorum]
MKSIRISQLLQIFAALFLVLIAVQSVLMLKQGKTLREDLLYNSEILIPTVQLVNDARFHAVQVQQWLTDISATRGQNGLDDGFDEAAQSAEGFRQTINRLIQLNPENQSAYRALLPAFDAYYQEGITMANAYIEGGPAQGNTMMASFDTRVVVINDALEGLFEALQSSIQTDIDHELSDIALSNTLVYLFAACFLIMLVLLLVVGQTRIVAPARYLSVELQAIAAGDFSRKVQTSNDDEFGQISHAAADIVNQLGESLRAITSAGMQVSAYAHALTYVTDDVQQQSVKQSEGTDVVISSIDHLTALGQSVAVETTQASEVSSEVKVQAEKGDKLLESSLVSAQELAERMDSAKSTVNELAESSNKISDVISVIQSIAEQTNLLALNAAIEAARAGEQGRGFAVVADEVRTLASRTQDSVSQIESMIQDLQNKANETVQLISRNQEQAAQNAQAGQDASESLRLIFSSIDELDRMNQNIKSATESQAGSLQEVINVVAESKSLSERFKRNSEQSDRFSKELSAQAKAFSDLASRLSVY